MAIVYYSIKFDSGIEKVLQGSDKNNLTYEITIPESTSARSGNCDYFKPILKDGYEIDTVENAEYVGDGVWRYNASGYITFTSKPIGGGEVAL